MTAQAVSSAAESIGKTAAGGGMVMLHKIAVRKMLNDGTTFDEVITGKT